MTTIYTAPLNGDVEFTGLELPKTQDTSKMRLTAFEDLSSPRPAYGDIYFSPSIDQSTITPPPTIRWKYKTRTIPLEIFILGMCGLFVFFMKKKPR